jgi:hypothetical protein
VNSCTAVERAAAIEVGHIVMYAAALRKPRTAKRGTQMGRKIIVLTSAAFCLSCSVVSTGTQAQQTGQQDLVGQSTCNRLQAISSESAPSADLGDIGCPNNPNLSCTRLNVKLIGCSIKEKTIVCRFVAKNKWPGGTRDFNANYGYFASRFIDNFTVPHQLTENYFRDGRRDKVDTVNLGSDGLILLYQEFSGDRTDGLESGRVVFSSDNKSLTVSTIDR